MNKYVQRIDQILEETDVGSDKVLLGYLRAKFEDANIIEQGYMFVTDLYGKDMLEHLCKRIDPDILVVPHNERYLISGF